MSKYKSPSPAGLGFLGQQIKADCPSRSLTAAIDHPQVVVGPAIATVVWKMTFDQIAPLDLEHFAQAHVDLVLNGLLTDSS